MLLQHTPDDLKLNIRGLTADRLRTFYYVASMQSTTLAGDKLGLCQSAVSKQLQQIEDDLGFLLFHRHGRKLTMTALGERIFELAEKVLFEIDGTLKSIKEEYEGENGGTIRIMTFPSFASVMIPYFLGDFYAQPTDLRLEIKSTFGEMLITDADIIIRDFIPRAEGLVQLPLYRQYIGFFASKAYLEAMGGQPVTLADLDRFHLIALEKSLEDKYKNINSILSEGASLKTEYRTPYLRFPSNEGVAAAVQSGMGIGELSYHHARLLNNPNLIRVIPSFVKERPAIYFIFNKNVSNTKKYHKIYDLLLSKVKSDAYIFDAPENAHDN